MLESRPDSNWWVLEAELLHVPLLFSPFWISDDRWPSLHSRTGRPRSGRQQKTRWSDVISLQMWQGIGLGCLLYWLVLNQQPMLHHFEPRFSDKRGRGLEETKIFSTYCRHRVWSCARWNIMYHRFSRMLPYNWYRPPHYEGHQWSPPDVLHLSTDFSCHHPRQRTGYESLMKEISQGVGWEALTFKMEMHCFVLMFYYWLWITNHL